MIRHLNEVSQTTTSHAAGMKQVLLAANESGCSITQIAVMHYHAGDVVPANIHPDLQDNFFILSGALDVILDGVSSRCSTNDFILVPYGVSCEMHAITDVDMLAIGCVIEAERLKLYPMLFEPNMHPVVWGGTRLMEWKQLGDENLRKQPVGESWEISAVPASPSIVSNGTWAGYSLVDVIARRPNEILGKAVARKYEGKLPLLAKFIDARDNLSIQVHPDDEMAGRVHGKMGKSEMWYVIDAQPGAYLYAGFKDELTPDEYVRRVADGTIVDVLARHEVHPGDVFYLPAGRIHAICSGILLAEIQQSSDVTYRIFDYNRPGMDGQPRELHTNLAAQALDYHVYDEYKTEYKDSDRSVTKCLDTPYFSVRLVDAEVPTHRDLIRYDSFIMILCTDGECVIRTRTNRSEVRLCEGYSCLVPAAIANYDIIPVDGAAHLVEAYVDSRQDDTILHRLSRFLHLSNK